MLRTVIHNFGPYIITGIVVCGLGFILLWLYHHPKLALEQNGIVYRQVGEDAVTLNVFKPHNANGAAVIFLASGNWISGPNFAPKLKFIAPVLRRGFTIIELNHRSQPGVSIPEIIEDIDSGVDYIRSHSQDWGVNANRLGIVGSSSGGHLACHLATIGGKDKIQAVAVFFPVTDLLRLDDEVWVDEPPIREQVNFGPNSKTVAQWENLARELSPVYHIDASTLPPILISHGGSDPDVPVEQSKRFLAKANELNAGPVELFIHPTRQHGYKLMYLDLYRFANFFEGHLTPK